MKKQKKPILHWTDHLQAVFWIIATNLVPLLGVWQYGWSPYQLILLYLAETWIIGIFNVWKIAMAESGWKSFNLNQDGTAGFFSIHYGLFVAIQTLLLLIFLKSDGDFKIKAFMLSVLQILAIHLFNFIVDFVLPKRHKQISADKQMFVPYGRIIVQQFLVIGGSIISGGMEKNADAFLVILVVLKMTVDYLLFLFKPKYLGEDARLYS